MAIFPTIFILFNVSCANYLSNQSNNKREKKFTFFRADFGSLRLLATFSLLRSVTLLSKIFSSVIKSQVSLSSSMILSTFYVSGCMIAGWEQVRFGSHFFLIFADYCTAPNKFIKPLLSMIPSTWRFLQCLRRYYDSKDKRHLQNAGKYRYSHFFLTFNV
jgi:hypothetical protein